MALRTEVLHLRAGWERPAGGGVVVGREPQLEEELGLLREGLLEQESRAKEQEDRAEKLERVVARQRGLVARLEGEVARAREELEEVGLGTRSLRQVWLEAFPPPSTYLVAPISYM